MFKPFCGNDEYLFSFNNEVIRKDGGNCTLSIVGGKVELPIYNKLVEVEFRWLCLMAHFEVQLPDHLKDRIFDIDFVNSKKNIVGKDRIIMVFNKPIVVMGDFHIVPGFTNYAISKSELTIISIRPLRLVNVHFYNPKENKYYPDVNVYSGCISRKINTSYHRLIALTFCHNDDRYNKYFINHKDGLKYHYDIDNLEWVTAKENSDHAFQTDLRDDNYGCRVLDTLTKKEYSFYSLTEMSRILGKGAPFGKKTVNYVRPTKIWKNRYEIRLEGDDSPWLYDKIDPPHTAGRYTINVTEVDGTNRTFGDTRDFQKHYKAWNAGGTRIDRLIRKAEKLHPGLKVEYVDSYNTRRVQAYSLQDKNIIEERNIFELSKN